MRAACCALLLGLLISLPLCAAAEGPGSLISVPYLLDDVGDREYALYSGPGMRSYVDPKYMVTSLQQLEARAAELPEGTSISWHPSRRSAAGKPLLFGKEENVALFEAFCKDHHLRFDIAAPPKP